jgi:D-glycero-D-manno-heptose 1,7-bisphosphate phosphatase
VSAPRPAVFLDRDGTLIEDVGYLDAIDRIAVFPWSVDAVRALNRAGLPVVVVTNQSGIARGLFSCETVGAVHDEISRRFADGHARVDAYYYCPHHPRGTVAEYARECDCRKPGCGLVERAARDLNLDLARSFVVGDQWTDIALAHAVNARGIFVRTGRGASGPRPDDVAPPAASVDNLAAAASWILVHADRP